MECVRAPRPDVVRACGLIAFAYIAMSGGTCCPWKRVVASLIVVNGLLCHLTQTCSCQRLDVLINALIILLLNTTSPDQPYLLLTTVMVLATWKSCHGRPERAWLHVLGVQWLGAYVLSRA